MTNTPEPIHSGRFLLRIATDLHDALAKIATKRGVSLNQYIQNILASHFAGVQTAEYAFEMFQAIRNTEFSDSMGRQYDEAYRIGYKQALKDLEEAAKGEAHHSTTTTLRPYLDRLRELMSRSLKQGKPQQERRA